MSHFKLYKVLNILGLRYEQAIQLNFSYGGQAQGWPVLPSKGVDAQEIG